MTDAAYPDNIIYSYVFAISKYKKISSSKIIIPDLLIIDNRAINCRILNEGLFNKNIDSGLQLT